MTRHRHLRIGRYDQHFHELLPQGKSPCDFLRSEYDVPEQQARKVTNFLRCVFGAFQGLTTRAARVAVSRL